MFFIGLKLSLGERISLVHEETGPNKIWKCHGIGTSPNNVFLYTASRWVKQARLGQSNQSTDTIQTKFLSLKKNSNVISTKDILSALPDSKSGCGLYL